MYPPRERILAHLMTPLLCLHSLRLVTTIAQYHYLDSQHDEMFLQFFAGLFQALERILSQYLLFLLGLREHSLLSDTQHFCLYLLFCGQLTLYMVE